MKLDVFIKGEVVDLCIPTKEFAASSNWYSWFNDQRTTRYLEQGIFPNSPEEQVRYFDEALRNRTRFMLIISDKENYIRTVSLSFINFQKKTSDIAMVIGETPVKGKYSNLIALESFARMT